MNIKEMVSRAIDHAILKPDATDKDIEREIKSVIKYNIATVCVKPCHVSLACGILKDSNILVSTVIGFPHGANTTECKAFEAVNALENGAKELDMVINIGKLISGDYNYVRNDITKVVNCAHERNAIVKVIIETAMLDENQKTKACIISEEAGADFVKTSTGFNGRGASLEDIILMKKVLNSNIKLKASGGIKTLEQAVEFINAGCLRLGTSSTVAILTEGIDKSEGSY
ncbi:UNVERIFIED_CONTAM: deoxyribose-phosphate aldolase [Acetivibrio alkalicellulosi]